jgi:phospholipid-translocating ATPase
MCDGIYQSVICFFMAYLTFYQGDFATESGRDIASRNQIGVFVACSAIIVVNVYILINQYRWDWLFLLITTISTLLVFLWTAIYSAFTSTGDFYQTAAHVFGSLTYWVTILLTVLICLLPRSASKVVQKLFFPRDVDIIREKVRQGEFAHLYGAPKEQQSTSVSSTSTSSEFVKPVAAPTYDRDDDRRPIYPPSVTTAGKRGSGHGSDGTDGSGGYGGGSGTFTPRQFSLERNRPSMDRANAARPSFDRIRASMDRTRASFEASSDFTSAAMLTRMESSHTQPTRHSFVFEQQ